MQRFLTTYLPVILFVGAMIALYVWDAPLAYLTDLTHAHAGVSHLAFVLLLFIATVFAPITVLPMVPVLAPVFGPFVTGVLSIIGWTSGAMVAFLISRHFGRPIAQQFISLSELDKAIGHIPENTRFFMIVLLRMAIPVDAMSYALGLVRTISFWNYTIATMIGVAWFSFIFAYAGTAYLDSQWALLIGISAVSIVLFLASWFILLRHYKKERGTSPEPRQEGDPE